MKKKGCLIIGNGGREHALVKALQDDSTQVYTLPARPLPHVKGVPDSCLKNKSLLASWIADHQIQLVIIGPEQPLVEGLSDFLRSENIACFGPSKNMAQLEGSKIFAKNFMQTQNIPTAPYKKVSSVLETLQASESFAPPYVLKADGLAGGKGVFICENPEELKEKAKLLFDKKIFGRAGEQALLEEFQEGQEMSFFILTNGKEYQTLPVAQDYKRLKENQKGPNTGGMGAIAPLHVPTSLREEIEKTIIQPSVAGLQNETYCGVLYIGIMVTQKGAKVLEYNVRFGDPEAQVLLPLLEGSWFDTFLKISEGKMPQLKWKPSHSACLVLTSKGYPENPIKGQVIEGDIQHHTDKSYFLQAGVRKNDKEEWIVNGGRVLNSIGLGPTLKEALLRAYTQAEAISFEGQFYRKDIGQNI